jgi:hypothetical protein
MKTFIIIYLLAITASSNAQQILKIGEVFDFNIGDEFHIKSNMQNQPPNASRLKVIDKYYSLDGDTVKYKISRDNYTSDYYSEPEPHLEYSFTKDTVVYSYANLDSSIFTYYSNLKYDSIVKNYDSHFSYDSIVEFSTDFCDSLINGFTCGLGDFEPNVYSYKFGKGIGLIFEYYEDGMSGGHPSTDKSLFFYKKAGEECGIPDNTTGVYTSNLIDKILVYPNPTESILNIELGENMNMILRLFDVCGKLHLEKNIVSYEFIDVSKFESGIYFLNFQRMGKQINTKIIIL